MSASFDHLVKELQPPAAPKKITQEPFDHDPGHYWTALESEPVDPRL